MAGNRVLHDGVHIAVEVSFNFSACCVEREFVPIMTCLRNKPLAETAMLGSKIISCTM